MIGIFGGAPLLQWLQGGQLRWDRLLLFWLYAAFLLLVMVIDYEQRRVLNIMVVPAYPLAFLFSFAAVQPDPWHAILGGVVGFVLFVLLALLGRGALGMGDVKLAGLIGVMTRLSCCAAGARSGHSTGWAGCPLVADQPSCHPQINDGLCPYVAMDAMIVLWQILRHVRVLLGKRRLCDGKKE